MAGKAKTVMAEPMEETALDLVRGGAALIRLENDVQMRVAIERPRNETAILEEARGELARYPEAAEEAIYAKPVGKDERGKMQYAEGLSIRAAESLANRWNNSSWGCEIVGENEKGTMLVAVFLDMERNTRHAIPRFVSAFERRKGGDIVKLSPDRFEMRVAAVASKALREVILRSLPAGLKAEYELEARKVIAEHAGGDENAIADRNRVAKMLAKFSRFAVSREEIERHMDKAMGDLTNSDLITLGGLYNALDAGEISAAETFGKKENGPKAGPIQGAPDATTLFGKGKREAGQEG